MRNKKIVSSVDTDYIKKNKIYDVVRESNDFYYIVDEKPLNYGTNCRSHYKSYFEEVKINGQVTCVNNGCASSSLTVGKNYDVVDRNANRIAVINDNNKIAEYLNFRFSAKETKSLPEKWAVLRSDPRVAEWVNKKYNKDYGFHICEDSYILSNGNYNWKHNLSKEGYEIISFETFLKEVFEKDKKIIGYKAPFDFCGGNVKKGDLFKQSSNVSDWYYGLNGEPKWQQPKEIVETWEPVYESVYEQQFKVGDIIWAKNCGGNGLSSRTTEELVEIVNNSFAGRATGLSNDWDIVVKTKSGNYYKIYTETAYARLATADDIKKNKEHIIKAGSHEVVVSRKGIFAEGVKINLEDLKGSISLLNQKIGKWDVSLTNATFKYGCWEEIKLSEINLIIKTYENINGES